MFFVFFKQKTAYEMRISYWSSDVCSSDLYSLVHPTAYYTLHAIPNGKKLAASEVSKRDSSVPPVTASSEKTKESGPAGPALSNDGQAASKVVPAVSLKEVNGLLAKHTCIACHNADKRQVGPAYKDRKSQH